MKFSVARIKSLPVWVKIPVWGIGSLLLLLLVAWLFLASYIHFNKKKILEKITTQLNANINGQLKIEDMNPALLAGFPGVAVALENVVLRDSLWQVHHHDLLNAHQIYVSVSVWSLLKKNPVVKNINITDASVYMFIDSSGYTNANLLKPRSTTGKKTTTQIRKLRFSNVQFTLDNRAKRKLFCLHFLTLTTHTKFTPKGWSANTKEELIFKDFSFNENKGSFLKNKKMRSRLYFQYDKATQTLSIPQQTIRLDDDQLQFQATFFLAKTPAAYSLKFIANQIAYKNAVALTTPLVQRKLNVIACKNPVDLVAFIGGKMKAKDTPTIRVNWEVKNNTLLTSGGAITNCNFSGYFLNNVISGNGANDQNSIISVPHFTGHYAEMPFTVDSLKITNLSQPILQGLLRSSFNLGNLNDAIGSDALTLRKGKANVSLRFKMGLKKNDTTAPYLVGNIHIQNLGFTYLPRKISFDNSSVSLSLNGKDLIVEAATLQTKSSVLHANGTIKNFLNLYYVAPEKMVMNFNVQSPIINLNEFESFLLTRRTTAQRKQQHNRAAADKLAMQMDDVFAKSAANINVSLAKVVYDKFTATAITGNVLLRKNNIAVTNATVHSSDGLLQFNAGVNQVGNKSNVALNAVIDKVNVQQFFYQFNNFGQQSITDENIRGIISAKANIQTQFTASGTLVGSAMGGSLDFTLQKGELNNFKPFLKISKFLFKKRNLDSVRFRDIKGRFELIGDKIKINPLHIESTAFTMMLQGVYGIDKGTNLLIDLPLRNPKKDADILNDSLRTVRSMKGIVLHLQAVDGSDGSVKIKLRSGAIREKAEALQKEAIKAKEK